MVGRAGLCLALGVALGSTASAQISPGALSAAHADLDGPLKCTECHAAGSKSLRERCVACHREIERLVAGSHGLHAREGKEECSSCHPEHAGRDFELVHWDEGGPERFDHARTGFVLEGRHAALACRDCHKAALQRSDVVPLLRRKDRGASWLGLGTDCASCHEDAHKGALGADCLRCHTTRKWKPAPGFDHAATDYPLTGKHASVACAKCHGEVPRYKPLPHAECSACHEDAHKGALGPGCARCHVTTGFRDVDRGAFDHERTRYPLRGAHRNVRCESCHDPQRAFGPRPAFDRCAACHADAHRGKATLAGRPADCAACHDVRAFRPSTFDVERHARAAYPLEGAHRRVACKACHTPDASPARVELRPAHAACRDCHAEAHGAQLAGDAAARACARCHTVQAFKPSTYGVAEHAALRLPLEGQHADAACAACHGPQRKSTTPPLRADVGTARVALALDTACASCHADPHDGRLAGGCATCHGVRAFAPSSVDAAAHDRFDYKLEGGHRAVPCALCHKELEQPRPAAGAPPRRLTFAAAHERCTDCHRGPHGTQFDARPGGGACDTCHDLEAFVPAARFDHDRDASFALKGAHARVACVKCHVPAPDGSVTYRPLSDRCESCHAGRPAELDLPPRRDG